MTQLETAPPPARPTAPAILAPAPAPASPPRDSERFVIALAKALHRRGLAAPRLEASLATAGMALGTPLQVLATPTALQLAFESPEGQRVVLVRQDPAEVDLATITALDEVLDAVTAGDWSPRKGLDVLAEIERRPPTHGAVAMILAFALASATAACFFGGGRADVAAAGLLGAVVGLGSRLASRREAVARIFDPAAALAVTLLAALPSLAGVPLGRDLVALAALIVLIPGFTVTVAMSELAERHLSSGSSRLFGAGITFLSLGLGVGIGQALVDRLGFAPSPPVGPGFPEAEIPALLLAPIAFGVLFQAHARHFGWIVVTAISGYLGAKGGAVLLGPELGSFVGALVVGLTGNGVARATGLPTMVCHVPGILLLVPGSVGFRSFSAFLADDALSGTETAFRMALVAAALAGGLLFANVILPPRRRSAPPKPGPTHEWPSEVPTFSPGTHGASPRDRFPAL